MQLAMVGLGRMGKGISTRLLRKGYQLVAYNRSSQKADKLAEEEGANPARSLKEAVEMLDVPRIVWMMLPSGQVVAEHIEALLPLLEPGDILIDGGNSHYTDDIPRSESADKKGVYYLDIGVSGGVWGLTEGFCMMIGGPRPAFEQIKPWLQTLAPENGYLYCGPTGAGHFVKMIHNGIEYGLLQALAEGFSLLRHSPFAEDLDFSQVCKTWNHGSVIRSWLLELAEKTFEESPGLEEFRAWVEDSGEGRWTAQQALESSVPAPVLSLALMERFRSREENSFSNRFIAALRHQFGGHEVKKKELSYKIEYPMLLEV